MLFRQYPQVLLTSFLIVGLTGRASIAFNIIPPNPYRGVGSLFHLKYHPGKGDPQLGVSLGGFAHGEIALVNTRTGKNTDSIFWQSNANNTVPVDAITFETVVSEPVLKIPENRLGVLTPIRLGIRITNNTSEPVRFSLVDLTPEFINFNDKLLFAGAVQFRLVTIKKSNFPLLLPKESFSFFWEGGLFWNENMLRLIIDDVNHGRSWSFGGFNSGIYRVRFKYNYDYEGQYYDEDVRGLRQFKGVIKGSFFSNWVEINLIQP